MAKWNSSIDEFHQPIFEACSLVPSAISVNSVPMVRIFEIFLRPAADRIKQKKLFNQMNNKKKQSASPQNVIIRNFGTKTIVRFLLVELKLQKIPNEEFE